jgi:Lrp/AsnC family transcriptional regulator, leucine-responsive regulatory protein
MPNIKLDEFDLKIIDHLQTEARLTNVELAERIGLSPSPCLRRVRLLENAGVIQGYAARIERAKVGLALTVFVEVKMVGHSAKHMETFRKWVQQTPAVVSCQLISGDADYLMEVVVSDLDEYTRLIVLQLRNLEGLLSMQSHFVMESVKRSVRLPLELRSAFGA